jgi:ribosomal protein S18 acetylase RimI-like enzyme
LKNKLKRLTTVYIYSWTIGKDYTRSVIQLRNLTETGFVQYKPFLIEGYAQDISKNYRVSVEEARLSSANQIEALLGQGLASPNQFLYDIVLANENGETFIGYLWFTTDDTKRQCFIYDFYLHEAFRGKGWGKKTLEVLEGLMKEQRIESIGLHVFAHNTAAHELYVKLGYQVTSFNMQKWLSH